MLIFFLLFFGTIAVVNGWAEYRSERERRAWPEVTVTFDHRSARLDYVTQDTDIPRTSAKVDVDLETGHIRVESQDYSWRGDRDHWYVFDGIDWIRYTNVEADFELLADMDRYASGMTIDQVLPPPARTHARIVEVREANVGGTPARHFTLLLDERRLAADTVASQAMDAWWGETIESPERYSNLELWVTDDGEVLRIRSASDVDDLFFSVRVVTTSDVAFDAELPSDFVDGD